MITYRIKGPNGLARGERAEKGSWVDVVDPNAEELALLERQFGAIPEHLTDILDIDEQARIEKEDEYTLLIFRLPVRDAKGEVPYKTMPIGILLFPDKIVTVCMADCETLEDLRSGRARGLDIKNKSAFVLHLVGRAAIAYLRYLKEINRSTASIERELQRSVRNHELTQLLAFEKALVFFTTSLKSNEILLEKLQASKAMHFKEDETELLEDVVTDNRQAIEMANIYSDILSGMMDAFASVISNNLNVQMKRLTSISVILMLSTLVVSAFSMNVDSPFTGKSWAFWAIAGIAASTSLVGGLLIRDRRRRKPRTLAAPAAAGLVQAGAHLPRAR